MYWRVQAVADENFSILSCILPFFLPQYISIIDAFVVVCRTEIVQPVSAAHTIDPADVNYVQKSDSNTGAATDVEPCKYSTPLATGFKRGFLCSLDVIRLYRNMSEIHL